MSYTESGRCISGRSTCAVIMQTLTRVRVRIVLRYIAGPRANVLEADAQHHATGPKWVLLDEAQINGTRESTANVTPWPPQVVKDQETTNTHCRCPTLDIGHHLRTVVRIMMENIDDRRDDRIVGSLATHGAAIRRDPMLLEP